MAFNRFGTFTLGVIIAAVSVGAVSFANAAGNTTLKACANKKSGTMRYISKGSCKKTEKSLSWSQMGPTGTNGQNYFAVDATGKTVGAVTGTSWGAYDVLIEGKIWNLASESVGYSNSSQGDASSAYSNSSCTTPYFKMDSEAPLRTWTTTNNIQGVAIDSGLNSYESVRTNSTYKAYQPSGAALSWTTSTVYFWDHHWDQVTGLGTYTCDVRSDAGKVNDAKNFTLYAAVEVVRPTYTAPLTLVAR
jgi:hypothetical protein